MITTGTKPRPRAGHTAVSVDNNRIILFGGGDGALYFNDINILNTSERNWEQPTLMHRSPSARGYHSAVYHVTQGSVVTGELL